MKPTLKQLREVTGELAEVIASGGTVTDDLIDKLHAIDPAQWEGTAMALRGESLIRAAERTEKAMRLNMSRQLTGFKSGSHLVIADDAAIIAMATQALLLLPTFDGGWRMIEKPVIKRDDWDRILTGVSDRTVDKILAGRLIPAPLCRDVKARPLNPRPAMLWTISEAIVYASVIRNTVGRTKVKNPFRPYPELSAALYVAREEVHRQLLLELLPPKMQEEGKKYGFKPKERDDDDRAKPGS